MRESESERGESLVCMTSGSTSLLSVGIISGLCLGSASLTCVESVSIVGMKLKVRPFHSAFETMKNWCTPHQRMIQFLTVVEQIDHMVKVWAADQFGKDPEIDSGTHPAQSQNQQEMILPSRQEPKFQERNLNQMYLTWFWLDCRRPWLVELCEICDPLSTFSKTNVQHGGPGYGWHGSLR